MNEKEFKEKLEKMTAYSYVRAKLIDNAEFVENNDKISNLQKDIEKKAYEDLLAYFDEVILKRVEL